MTSRLVLAVATASCLFTIDTSYSYSCKKVEGGQVCFDPKLRDNECHDRIINGIYTAFCGKNNYANPGPMVHQN